MALSPLLKMNMIITKEKEYMWILSLVNHYSVHWINSIPHRLAQFTKPLETGNIVEKEDRGPVYHAYGSEKQKKLMII